MSWINFIVSFVGVRICVNATINPIYSIYIYIVFKCIVVYVFFALTLLYYQQKQAHDKNYTTASSSTTKIQKCALYCYSPVHFIKENSTNEIEGFLLKPISPSF